MKWLCVRQSCVLDSGEAGVQRPPHLLVVVVLGACLDLTSPPAVLMADAARLVVRADAAYEAHTTYIFIYCVHIM